MAKMRQQKMAPHIPHLLRNAELWGIMLKYFSGGKMKELCNLLFLFFKPPDPPISTLLICPPLPNHPPPPLGNISGRNNPFQKDNYFSGIIMRLLGKFPWTNTKKTRPGEAMNDEFFVLWLCKVTHTQISHLRSLKQFPDRFSYRLNKLDAPQLTSLNALFALMTHVLPKASSFASSSAPSECSATGDKHKNKKQKTEI